MLEGETWDTIQEFPKYLVSTHGRIRHRDRIEPRKLTANERGFPLVVLFKEDAKVRYVRHVNLLVAKRFVPSTVVHDPSLVAVEPQNHIWHIDGNLRNCRWDNLRWATRSAVYEWNRMHRELCPAFKTPKVKNNRTGDVYENAFECGMAEGELESKIMWRIEKQADNMFDDEARYRYL